jgi:hypothetical protein
MGTSNIFAATILYLGIEILLSKPLNASIKHEIIKQSQTHEGNGHFVSPSITEELFLS